MKKRKKKSTKVKPKIQIKKRMKVAIKKGGREEEKK
jgi:hypothetical protein